MYIMHIYLKEKNNMNKIYYWFYYKWIIIKDKAIGKMINNKPNNNMKLLIRFLKESNLYYHINFDDFEVYNIFFVLKQKDLMEEILPFVINKENISNTNKADNDLIYLSFVIQWKIMCYLDPNVIISKDLDTTIIDLYINYKNYSKDISEPLQQKLSCLYDIFLKKYTSNVNRR